VTYTQPSSFTSIPFVDAVYAIPATASEFAAVVTAFINGYLVSGHLFSGRPYDHADEITGGITASMDRRAVRETNTTEWVLVSPGGLQGDPGQGSDPTAGVWVRNDHAPDQANNAFLETAYGAIPAARDILYDAEVTVAVARATRFQSFLLGESIYRACMAVQPLLARELSYRSVRLSPLKAAPTESAQFRSFSGDIVLFSLKGTYIFSHSYSIPSPV